MYKEHEGKIRRELTAFWEVLNDIWTNPDGEPFEDTQKVRTLQDRCPLAHQVMIEVYRLTYTAVERRDAGHKKALQKHGLEMCMNRLEYHMLMEDVTKFRL